MSDSSRDTSPDPIVLPSSPLSGRRPPTRRLTTPARMSRATPSKSLFIDTPGNGQSPWRIKVTVQAESRDGGSPGKTKKLASGAFQVSSEESTRKRKGTPIRGKRSAPQWRSQRGDVEEPEVLDHGDAIPSQTPPNHRRASGRMARLNAQWSNGTGRTKRLSLAREELDQALQDAVGSDGPGEMTLSRAEDFTMVTMESLQTAKDASLPQIPEKSFTSSPPRTDNYPDISTSVARVREQASASLQSPFEPMSSTKKKPTITRESEMNWQKERDSVTQQIRNASPRDVVVVDDAPSESEEDVEEADLFSQIPPKPPRSKLPRNWRKSSGMNFSYVDSPAHPSEERRQSTDGSGVLTPPDTDERNEEVGTLDLQGEADEQLQSEFTQPDMEATRYQNEEEVPSRNDSKIPEDEGGDDTGDSGTFFQQNLPQVLMKERPRRRPPRRPTADIAELLNLDGSPVKANPVKISSARTRPIETRNPHPIRCENRPSMRSTETALNSPLRKSLYHGSKLTTGAPAVNDVAVQSSSILTHDPITGEPLAQPKRRGRQRRVLEQSQTETTSMSDQRQLLDETAASLYQQANRPDTRVGNGDYFARDTRARVEDDDGTDANQESSHQNMVSYQEELNLDSPTKIKVKFDDSTQNSLHDTSTLISNTHQSSTFISRITSTFWNAVTNSSRSLPAPSFPPTLRSQLRSRYGVLSCQHPWSMAHIRTLHRMLNSRISGRSDTLVPRNPHLQLPHELERQVHTVQTSVTGYKFLFDRAHAAVVWSFLQLLVTSDVIEGMQRGEIAFIGDDLAGKIRGWFDPTRHGDHPVWREDGKVSDGVRRAAKLVEGLRRKNQEIGMEFVCRAVGDCVLSNDLLKKRLEMEGKGGEFERVCFGMTPEI